MERPSRSAAVGRPSLASPTLGENALLADQAADGQEPAVRLVLVGVWLVSVLMCATLPQAFEERGRPGGIVGDPAQPTAPADGKP